MISFQFSDKAMNKMNKKLSSLFNLFSKFCIIDNNK